VHFLEDINSRGQTSYFFLYKYSYIYVHKNTHTKKKMVGGGNMKQIFKQWAAGFFLISEYKVQYKISPGP